LTFQKTINIAFRRYSAGDYLLFNYDWAALCKEYCVGAVTETMDLAIPYGLIRKNEHRPWFPGKLKFYIKISLLTL
jgi:hypothetical protein